MVEAISAFCHAYPHTHFDIVAQPQLNGYVYALSAYISSHIRNVSQSADY